MGRSSCLSHLVAVLLLALSRRSFSRFRLVPLPSTLAHTRFARSYNAYYVNERMLIPAISLDTAQKILRVGRGINFLRACAPLAANQPDVDMSLTVSLLSNPLTLNKIVDRYNDSLDKRIVSSMFDDYDLLEHLKALKKFLLLGQGDFVSALLDAVGPELSKAAENVYRHNLTGVLDTALRGTNAQYLPQDILDRVGVKLYEPSPHDAGWDIFSLDYHVDTPLTAVIHARASARYRRIFHLLWRLKRIEWSLNITWRRAVSVNHALSRGRGKQDNVTFSQALRRVALLRQEMLHVTSNFQNYLMFEVLEGSWNEMEKRLKGAKTLEEVIEAHDDYLNSILKLALLGDDPESKLLYSQLGAILDQADRFCGVQVSHEHAPTHMCAQSRAPHLFTHCVCFGSHALCSRIGCS